MAQPHEHASATAAASTQPRCKCDQQLADSLPLLLVAAAVILVIERLRSWARRRREAHEKPAQ